MVFENGYIGNCQLKKEIQDILDMNKTILIMNSKILEGITRAYYSVNPLDEMTIKEFESNYGGKVETTTL